MTTPSPIKRRRATKAQKDAFDQNVFEITREQAPMSVRQVFYQCVCRGVVEKSEAGYARVQRSLSEQRLDGRLPFDWIADYGRDTYKPLTFDSVPEALSYAARRYRRALWTGTPSCVEFWLEKAALQGVIGHVTAAYDVPLQVSRGFSSITFLQESAAALARQNRPCYVYQFGDHDPSGVSIAESTEARLREFAPGAEIHFERVAVTLEQIDLYDLPTRPTKETDSRAKNWIGGSVEVDAIAPDTLRGLVQACIMRHVTQDELDRVAEVEEQDRDRLSNLAYDAYEDEAV